MKRTIVCILMILIIPNIYSQNEINFNNYQWNTTSENIIINEGEPDYRNIFGRNNVEDTLIYYNRFIESYLSTISYYLFNNELYFGRYTFNNDSLDNCIVIFYHFFLIFNSYNNEYSEITEQMLIEQIKQSHLEIINELDYTLRNHELSIFYMQWYHQENRTGINIMYSSLDYFYIMVNYYSPDFSRGIRDRFYIGIE